MDLLFPFVSFCFSVFKGKKKKKKKEERYKGSWKRNNWKHFSYIFFLGKEQEYLSSNPEELQTFPLRVLCHLSPPCHCSSHPSELCCNHFCSASGCTLVVLASKSKKKKKAEILSLPLSQERCKKRGNGITAALLTPHQKKKTNLCPGPFVHPQALRGIKGSP